ncbi:hypothetical protein MBOE_24430 [Mycolicibacterium boenickei]|uniref:Uncharacterized protein n=1 Tax=Mycolicibacterium boenickei TaxID=146017 RepID=A0ABN5ZCX1_9MYCO|nr:hypothetical protein MBOE_24430 [Mycolicibacterium boenickei]
MPTPGEQRRAGFRHDRRGAVLLDDVNDVPAQPLQHPIDAHIEDILSPARQVLFAVILGADLEILSTHVDAADI